MYLSFVLACDVRVNILRSPLEYSCDGLEGVWWCCFPIPITCVRFINPGGMLRVLEVSGEEDWVDSTFVSPHFPWSDPVLGWVLKDVDDVEGGNADEVDEEAATDSEIDMEVEVKVSENFTVGYTSPS